MKKRMNQNGFTLLEMTIVVIIISVIFLLSVPSIQKTLGVVNSKGCKAMTVTPPRFDTNIPEYEHLDNTHKSRLLQGFSEFS